MAASVPLGTASRVPDGFGRCVCPESAPALAGACVPYALLVPAVLLPLAAAAAAAAWWLVRRWVERRDSGWKIERKDVVFDVPPKVLGRHPTQLRDMFVELVEGGWGGVRHEV
jgi:hypothetical protein